MKRILLSWVLFLFFFHCLCFAEGKNINVLLLISEQNAQGIQQCWWVDSGELSVLESRLASLIEAYSFSVKKPAQVLKVLRKKKVSCQIDLTIEDAVKLGSLLETDYVILGKTEVGVEEQIPELKMFSYMANTTVKVIRIKDSQIIHSLSVADRSIHPDMDRGIQETLFKAAEKIAVDLINVFN